MRPLRSKRHQRGVAIITALLLTTLAITVVGSLFWQQQVQVRSIENQRLQLQKQWVLRGALDWTRLILREDARYSTVDHLGEPWAVTLAETRLDQYVEGANADSGASDAKLSGSIVDAQGRYNLTNLVKDGLVNEAEVAAFGRLLSNVQLDPSLARAAAVVIASTYPPKTQEGTQQGERSTGGETSRPMKFEYVDDLLAVPGFTPEMVAKLREFVVVLPKSTPINVNTAPAEVLAARIDTLSLSEAAALVAARENTYFKDTNDFMQRLSGKPTTGVGDLIATSTGYFLVNGKVQMYRASMDMQALVERNQQSTRILWIREN